MKKSLITLLASFSLLIAGFSVALSKNTPSKVEAVGKSSYWNTWISNNSSALSTGGTTLVTALKNKITQVSDGSANTVSYDGLWNAYKTSDSVPGANGTKIWDMYGGFQFTFQEGGKSYSNEGDCYNREHSVPKSWFGESKPAYSDLVHLVPTDGKVNGMRSNYAFGEVASASYTYSFPARSYNSVQYQNSGSSKLGSPKSINGVSTSESVVFEPDDQYKGDFARIYMYFAVRYGGGSCKATSGSGGAIFSTSFTNDNPYVTNYGLALLQKWHVQDPVSEKETTRNDAIESIQGNRNPFVDYPEWADKIFGTNYGGGGSSSNPTVNSVSVSPSSLNLDLNGVTSGTLNATVSVSNNASQAVAWTSSNTNVATVNNSGVVSAVAVGNAVIRATSTFDNTKYGECTVTVTDSSQGGDPDPIGGSETITMSEQGFTEAGVVTSVSGNNCTLTFSKGSGTNDPKYYGTGSSVRIYPNNTLTISSSQTIIGITFTFGTSDGTNAITASTGTFDSPTWTGSANSITFTSGGSSGHRRIAAVTITYQGSSQATLSSITLNTDNVTKTFNVGDTFTYAGLVVTAHYSDDSSAVVTPTSISTPNMSIAGQKTITVTYQGKTATYTITVNAPVATSITATVNKTFYVGETITKSDITVKDNLNNTIDDYAFANYQFTYEDAASGGALTNKEFAISYNNMDTTLVTQVQRKAYSQASSSVTDTLTASDLAATGTTYANFSGVTKSSGAVYAGQSAKDSNGNIQIRSKNSNSGIITTTSGGTISSVTITVGSGSNTVNVYGKNSAYSSASDLFNSGTQGTLVGTRTTTGTITFNTNYTYVGICSASGALYLSSVTISYAGSSETAENVANYIMYQDTNNQCLTRFGVASGYFENMSKSERSTFMTSSDYVISLARSRFTAWAAHQEKTISYIDGDYVIRSSSLSNQILNQINSDNSIVLIITISALMGTSVMLYFVFKRKRA